ncbi:2'-5' RNA ligase family protein [Acaryochloris sp. IP29b_bin.137]|uniref:2'-5' RNA ligase family protein n=1 Tax=Acaryochloris sp. IP29b_bin.137 TaxID=2969217 RepID=UPI00262E75AC|nr:2'-5' RNA ligase family protein [Acaryochloris sp. IP29b_bin.137]
MARYFLALLPPESVQEEVLAIQKIFAMEYQSRKALNAPPHITLQAPFEWPPASSTTIASIDAVVQALYRWADQHQSIPIQLSGFGAFAPRVIYIKVQLTPELLDLHSQLQTYCAQAWLIQDNRAQSRSFVPHMTVAFRDLKRASFYAAWPFFQDRQFDHPFVATDITLLKHNGQRWEIFDQAAFGN